VVPNPGDLREGPLDDVEVQVNYLDKFSREPVLLRAHHSTSLTSARRRWRRCKLVRVRFSRRCSEVRQIAPARCKESVTKTAYAHAS
jgi:hypothetical protein